MDKKKAMDLLNDLIGFGEDLKDLKYEYNIPWYIEDIHFSDYDEALKIAIKSLEQEPFINKPCVSTEACKHDKIKTLDRLSDEIKDTLYVDSAIFTALYDFKDGKIDVDEVIAKFNHETRIDVLKIIEEFKKEELKK